MWISMISRAEFELFLIEADYQLKKKQMNSLLIKRDRPRGRIISAGPSAIKSVFQNKAACKSKYKNLETPKIIWWRVNNM